MTTHFAVVLVALILSACSPSSTYTPPQTQPDAAVQPPQNFCGSKQKHMPLLPFCTDTCVPDEQVFFFCTEKMGKIAYTRQFLTDRQAFGYSLEYKDSRCDTGGVLVWQLSYIEPQPTNASVGMMSNSTVNSDCSKEPLRAPFIDSNKDKLYYVPLATAPM